MGDSSRAPSSPHTEPLPRQHSYKTSEGKLASAVRGPQRTDSTVAWEAGYAPAFADRRRLATGSWSVLRAMIQRFQPGEERAQGRFVVLPAGHRACVNRLA